MDSISIRELASSDYLALARFNSSFPEDQRSTEEWLERFRYWWDDNPAYDDTWQRGFLLLDQGKIVGFVGSFPTYFKSGGCIVKAFNGTTWRVLPEYRKWSIELWTCNREVSKHYLSFNTTPTDDVIKMITRLKYFKYPWGDDRYSYLICDPRSFCALLPGRYSRWIKMSLVYLLKIVQWYRLSKLPGMMSVRSVSYDPSDVDKLWVRTAPQYQYTNVRDSKAVLWYSKGKEIRYVYNRKKLVAFCIYLQAKKSDGKKLTMADFWHDRSENLLGILGSLIRYDKRSSSREPGLSTIRYPHFSSAVAKALEETKLSNHAVQYTGFVRLPNGSGIELTPENSYFTLLQGDLGA